MSAPALPSLILQIDAAAQVAADGLPLLAHLIGRAAPLPADPRPLDDVIAARVGWPQQVPWGRLCAAAARGPAQGAPVGTHLIVEPVMLVAGMNSLSMQRAAPPPAHGVDAHATPLATLAALLQPVFADYGAGLQPWRGLLLAHFPTRLDLTALPLSDCVGRELRDCLPTGPDAGRLRRLMTECQMVLHAAQDPLRQAAGGPAWLVNGVWLHGDNADPAPAGERAPSGRALRLFSDRPLLQALGAQTPASRPTAGPASPEGGAGLPQALTGTLAAGHSALWQGTLAEPALPALLGAARRLLGQGLLADLQLGLWPRDGGAGHQWRLRRTDLWRFWRQPADLAALLADPRASAPP